MRGIDIMLEIVRRVDQDLDLEIFGGIKNSNYEESKKSLELLFDKKGRRALIDAIKTTVSQEVYVGQYTIFEFNGNGRFFIADSYEFNDNGDVLIHHIYDDLIDDSTKENCTIQRLVKGEKITLYYHRLGRIFKAGSFKSAIY